MSTRCKPADVARQLLHRAESLVHALEAIAHQLERFAQAFLERALQFLVDRRAHLVDLLRVVFLQLFQAQIDDRAQAFEPRFVRLRQLAGLLRNRLELAFQDGADFADRLQVRLAQFLQRAAQFFALRFRRMGRFLAVARRLLAIGSLGSFLRAMELLETLVIVRRLGRLPAEQEKRSRHDDADGQAEKSGENRIHAVR